jgi:hypothetical protein
MLTIQTDIPASVQESSFMNATLQGLERYGLAVSIAVHLPDQANDRSQLQLVAMLREDFKHLTDIGYAVEVQIGEDDQ